MEAIILAGGFGTRLKSVVRDVPKSMALINNRPFLEYQLDYLIGQGIDKVILSVGYKREVIISHFKNRYRSLDIDYAVEEEPLGTGGGIRLSFFNIKSPRAFVLNGDSIFRIGLSPLMEFHNLKKADISIALRKLPDTGRFGRVTLNRNRRISGFTEKDPAAGKGLINSGVYVVNKHFLMDPDFRGAFSIERDCFERYYQSARFFGYPSEGYFLDIGIPEDYNKAKHDFEGFGN
ncbi:MAG: nucleotidyltransferase family protein [bacterium]